MATRPLRCPVCGSEMNHHADKVDYTAALENPAAADPALRRAGGGLHLPRVRPHRAARRGGRRRLSPRLAPARAPFA